MAGGKKLPDAWDDDDWETQADKAEKEVPSPVISEPEPVKTKSERLAQHKESNRKLWESAEAPPPVEVNYALATATTNYVPLPQPFKPALKVLSRKPAPKTALRRDPITGIEQLTILEDADDEDAAKEQLTPEQIRERQAREREEKQKRYDEARAKYFGDQTANAGPRPVTDSSTQQNMTFTRGRGRGGRAGGRGAPPIRDVQIRDGDETVKRSSSQAGTRELFDPGYAPKPISLQKRNTESPSSRPSTPKEESQVIRAPRGPDGSGRGGFGFAKRGAKAG